MELDERLEKIATGISVSDAIDAYMKDLADEGEPIDDVESAREDELLAIVEIMFLMAAVDGEVQAEEIQQLRASIEALADIQAGPDLELDRILGEFASRLAEEGWKSRLEQATARVRTPDSKFFAFRLAVGVAFVDDFVAHAEAAAIETLARALGLDPEEAQDVLHDVHETLFGA